MNGKSKCRILKDIRREIARNNDIEFITSECTFQGNCSGTCPKCEAEVRYLEQELNKRQRAGKAVAVAGIAAAMMVTATGCSLDELFPQEAPPMGSAVDTYYDQTASAGGMSAPSENTPKEQEIVLQGDIAYIPDTTPELVPGEVPDPN